MKLRSIKVDPNRPSREILQRAADMLRLNGVVALPTISFYGLCADAMSESAFNRVLEIKHRPAEKALPIFIPDVSWIDRLSAGVNPGARLLMERFWPGGLTLVVRAADNLPPHLVSPEGAIGLRMPSHPVALGVAVLFKGPITGTSANPAGQPPCCDAECVSRSLTVLPDMILDGGPTPGGMGSTVLDMTGETPRFLRQGIVPEDSILDTLRGASPRNS